MRRYGTQPPHSTQRTTSTKTRIKTPEHKTIEFNIQCLREQLPLKQGLRPHVLSPSLWMTLTQRTTSTKTRIKTHQRPFCHHKDLLSQRTTSTKTRIKTLLYRPIMSKYTILREQLPLKQGLRLSILALYFQK